MLYVLYDLLAFSHIALHQTETRVRCTASKKMACLRASKWDLLNSLHCGHWWFPIVVTLFTQHSWDSSGYLFMRDERGHFNALWLTQTMCFYPTCSNSSGKIHKILTLCLCGGLCSEASQQGCWELSLDLLGEGLQASHRDAANPCTDFTGVDGRLKQLAGLGTMATSQTEMESAQFERKQSYCHIPGHQLTRQLRVFTPTVWE